MREISVRDNPRIELLLDMVRDISRATSPTHVLTAFSQRYWRLRPVDYFLSISVRRLEPGQYKVTRRVRTADVLAGRVSASDADPWRDWDRMPTYRGGFLGRAIDPPEPKIFHNLHITGDPALGNDVADMGSCIVNPLFDNGEALNFAVAFRRDPTAYTVDELEQALVTGNLVGGTNRRLVLVEEVRKLNEALRGQFEQVARLQRALLPQKLPDIPGLQIATSYLTSDEAGGDYYDFFPLDDGRWGILIADVSGHGAAAAAVMAMLHAIVHGFCDPDQSPASVLRYANHRLVQSNLEGSFVTAFFAVYDPAQGTLTYSRAGHNPPRRKDGRTGEVTPIDGAATLPLGVFEPYEAENETIDLRPDDTIILYTDGITEAFNQGREMFGTGRLDESLLGCSGAPDCIIDSVHAALYRHTGLRTRADDQTLVALRYVGTRLA